MEMHEYDDGGDKPSPSSAAKLGYRQTRQAASTNPHQSLLGVDRLFPWFSMAAALQLHAGPRLSDETHVCRLPTVSRQVPAR